jgi:hypothetical protein
MFMNSPVAKLQFFTPSYVALNPKQIVEQIEKLRAEITDTVGRLGPAALTTPIVLCKQTDIIYLTSRLSDISIRRLEKSSQHLVVLTYVLIVFTAILCVLTYILVKVP